MKPSLLLTLLLLFAIGSSAVGQDIQWTDVQPGGLSGTVREIDHAAGDIWYAVSEAVLMKSTDGGQAWWAYGFSGMIGYDVEFLNDQVGFVTGLAASCNCGVILKTTNAGEEWTPTTFPGIELVTDIQFVDSAFALASATQGSVMKTTDGGETWAQNGPGSGSGMHFLKLAAPTRDIAYATAFQTGGPASGLPNKLYKSTNGGMSWDKIMDNGQDTMMPIYYGIYFTSATVGYAAGRDAQRSIWKTTDGGASWVRQFQMPGPVGVSMRDVKFLTDSVGFAVGDRGRLMRTVNAGQAWFSEGPPTLESLVSLEFMDKDKGFVGGTNGTFWMREVTYQPTVEVDPTSLDFGKMTEGTKDLTFDITPGNDAGLIVNSLTVVDADAAGFSIVSPTTGFPKNIEPGATLTVTVRFTPRPNLNARVFGAIEIASNDPRTPTTQVILRADATTGEPEYPVLRISRSLVEFGQVQATLSKDDSLEISTGNTVPLQLDSLYIIGVGGEPYGLSIVSPTGGYPIVIPPDTPLKVILRFAPAEPRGEVNAELVVKTNDPEDPEVHVTIAADAEDPPNGVDDFVLPKELNLW